MKRLVLCSFLLLIATPGRATIDVEIVDYPSRVMRYGPILVTARVENRGVVPFVIPVTDLTSSSYFVETGTAVENLTEFRPIQSTGGGAVVSLNPGASWFFQVDLGPWFHEPGSLVVAAGIKSTGECQHRATKRETFPLKLIRKEPGIEVYECWSGRAVSHPVSIDVVEPDAAVNQLALGFVLSPDFPVSDGRLNYRVRFGFNHLLERYPTSHYTYAAGFYQCRTVPNCLRQLLDLQPSHPLTPYMRLQLALSLLESGRGSEVTGSFIDELRLPDGLRQYLSQRIQEVKAP